MSSAHLKQQNIQESYKTFEDFINEEATNLCLKYQFKPTVAVKILKQIAVIGRNQFKYSEEEKDLQLGEAPSYLLSIEECLDIPLKLIEKEDYERLKNLVSRMIISDKIDCVMDHQIRLQEIIFDHKFIAQYDPKNTKEKLIKEIQSVYESREESLIKCGEALTLAKLAPNTDVIFKSVKNEIEKYSLNIEFPSNYKDEKNIREKFFRIKKEIISYWSKNGLSSIAPIKSIFKNAIDFSRADGKLVLDLEKQDHPEVYRSRFANHSLYTTGGIHSLFTLIIEHLAKYQVMEALNTSTVLGELSEGHVDNYTEVFNHFEAQGETFNSKCLYFYTVLSKDEEFIDKLIRCGEETINKKRKFQEKLVNEVNDFLGDKYNNTLSTKLLHFSFADVENESKKKNRAIREFLHRDNYKKLHFAGKDYSFGKKQASVIKVLFEYFESDTKQNGLSKDQILTRVRDNGDQPIKSSMRELFRSNGRCHPFFATILIFESKPNQSYRLDLLKFI